MTQRTVLKLKAAANPASVFLSMAVFVAMYLIGIRPACWPLAIGLVVSGLFGIAMVHGWKVGWFSGDIMFAEKRIAHWRKIAYVGAALLAVEMLLSLSITDVGTYGLNSLGNSFSAVRILKTPTGPVERVYSSALGFAIKPCPRCADKAMLGEFSFSDLAKGEFKNHPGGYMCFKGKTLLKKDPAAIIGLFSNEMEPHRAMKNDVWNLMESCARRIKEWPEGAVFVGMNCPTDNQVFSFERVTIGKCR